ncbi:MAG TPA: hypothetical protein VMM27_03630, partial [Casimicrobiaceae bacterium]|nr:hypothetical protein [Casimicrobiaceae bacterium]
MPPHIPAAVERKEKTHIKSRRRKFGIADDAKELGIALSGGGIRSATVSLGVFQYLAHEEKRARDAIAQEEADRKLAALQAEEQGADPAPETETAHPPRLLSRIDYCSSVSGGGYFATFFCSLFLPKAERTKGAQVTPDVMFAKRRAAAPVPSPDQAAWKLAADRATDVLCDTTFDGSRMTPMRWLRENGRYLAPTGSNDYLFALAVGIRNFLALHYVIAVSLVTIFLLFAAARVFGFAYGFDSWFGEVEARFLPDRGANFWPSAWWILPIASLALIVVPVGIAFFLAQTERLGKRFPLNLPLITAIAIAPPCFVYALTGASPPLGWPPAWPPAWPAAWISAIGAADLSLTALEKWDWTRIAAAYIALAVVLAILFYVPARIMANWRAREPAATTITRTKLSQWLLGPLIVTLALAAFALVDTIGQTIYALWTVDAYHKWLAGGGVIALLIPLLQKLLPLVTGSGDPTTKPWLRIPLSSLAFIAGVALFVAVASLWSALTHGLIWEGAHPGGDPGCWMMMPEDQPPPEVSLDTAQRIVVGTSAPAAACEPGGDPLPPSSWAWLFVPLLLISLLTGHGVGFINLSSLQRYYAGHLMRSYLRASRFAEDPNAERDVRSAERTDDITLKTYYHPSSLAPL